PTSIQRSNAGGSGDPRPYGHADPRTPGRSRRTLPSGLSRRPYHRHQRTWGPAPLDYIRPQPEVSQPNAPNQTPTTGPATRRRPYARSRPVRSAPPPARSGAPRHRRFAALWLVPRGATPAFAADAGWETAAHFRTGSRDPASGAGMPRDPSDSRTRSAGNSSEGGVAPHRPKQD